MARLGLTVLSSKYTEFNNAPTTHANPNPPFGNVPFTAFDASGKWLSHASPVTLTSGVEYEIPTSFGLLGFGISDYYNAGFYWDPDNVTKQRAYDLVDAQASLALTDHHSKSTLWGKNITGTPYYLVEAEQGSPFGDISAPAAPATYGIRFSYDY
jgi:iron complex outermembrane receptor protein